MGVRGVRFAAIVDNCVVSKLFVEQPGKYEVSGAEPVIKYL